jgi:hypothetical protein
VLQVATLAAEFLLLAVESEKKEVARKASAR